MTDNNTEKFKKGQRVIYCPPHSNFGNPDNEIGVVTSVSERYVFVNYGHSDGHGLATLPENLKIT